MGTMAYPVSTLAADKVNATVTLDDHAPHHNALANGVNDIVTELGLKPSVSILMFMSQNFR